MALFGCHKTHVTIRTEYENKVTDRETRKVESETTLYGTVKECGAWLEKLLRFVNKEVMLQRGE